MSAAALDRRLNGFMKRPADATGASSKNRALSGILPSRRCGRRTLPTIARMRRANPATIRRRRLTVLAVLVALAVALVVVVRGSADEELILVPAGPGEGETYDPLAYEDGKRAEFERRAARGFADILYEKSPGGIVASAARTARWRPLIERVATQHDADPALLEAVVLLESAGRSDVFAGDDVAGAAGLAQILAETATGLLEMEVDVERSRTLTAAIADAEAEGDARRARRLRARRRRVDDRFDPRAALTGMARYLQLAREHLGRPDLAVASYHMGIGNLDNVLERFGEGDDVPYAEVYFGSSPLSRPRAYELLSSFGDDSSTYLWRVLAAREIMRLYRDDRDELVRRAATQEAGDAAGPRGGAGDLVGPPSEIGRLRIRFRDTAGQARLTQRAMAVVVYIAAGTRRVTSRGTLTVVRTTNADAAPHLRIHTGGDAFDVAREYASREHALAFEFMLNRLKALDLITWQRDADDIHVVVKPDSDELLPDDPGRLLRDALRVPDRQ